MQRLRTNGNTESIYVSISFQFYLQVQRVPFSIHRLKS